MRARFESNPDSVQEAAGISRRPVPPNPSADSSPRRRRGWLPSMFALRKKPARALFITILLVGWSLGRVQADESASGWIAAGTPGATPFYVQASTNRGPTVLIIAGIHGDELAGPYAAEQLRHWPVRRGKLMVVPRANAVALAAGTRTFKSEAATNRLDLNRCFPRCSMRWQCWRMPIHLAKRSRQLDH